MHYIIEIIEFVNQKLERALIRDIVFRISLSSMNGLRKEALLVLVIRCYLRHAFSPCLNGEPRFARLLTRHK